MEEVREKATISLHTEVKSDDFFFFLCFFLFLIAFSCDSSEILVYNHFVLPILLFRFKPLGHGQLIHKGQYPQDKKVKETDTGGDGTPNGYITDSIS